jgi:hypothetical protein
MEYEGTACPSGAPEFTSIFGYSLQFSLLSSYEKNGLTATCFLIDW